MDSETREEVHNIARKILAMNIKRQDDDGYRDAISDKINQVIMLRDDEPENRQRRLAAACSHWVRHCLASATLAGIEPSHIAPGSDAPQDLQRASEIFNLYTDHHRDGGADDGENAVWEHLEDAYREELGEEVVAALLDCCTHIIIGVQGRGEITGSLLEQSAQVLSYAVDALISPDDVAQQGRMWDALRRFNTGGHADQEDRFVLSSITWMQVCRQAQKATGHTMQLPTTEPSVRSATVTRMFESCAAGDEESFHATVVEAIRSGSGLAVQMEWLTVCAEIIIDLEMKDRV